MSISYMRGWHKMKVNFYFIYFTLAPWPLVQCLSVFVYFEPLLPLPRSTLHLCRNPHCVQPWSQFIILTYMFFSLLLPFTVSVALHVAFVAFVWFQALRRLPPFSNLHISCFFCFFRSKTTTITIRILLCCCSQPKRHLPHRLHVPQKKSQPS